MIGILAAITIVAYSGIQDRARTDVLLSDLGGAFTILSIDNITNGTYPSSLSSANGGKGMPSSLGATYTYNYNAVNNSYCLSEVINGISYTITDTRNVATPGTCPSGINGGVVTTIAGSSIGYAEGTGAVAKFKYPNGIAKDSSGNLFVADRGNSLIRKITAGGVVSTFAGSGAQGSLDGAGSSAQFYYPEGLVFDNSGNLYVADRVNNLIRKITPSAVVSTFAGSGVSGSANGTGIAAQFNEPYGIAIDSVGNFYVADSGNNKIRKITSSGVVTTLAGSGSLGQTDATGTSASFRSPYGLAVDSNGNVFVADFDNNKIRKITPSGVVTTFAGNGSTGYLDGTGTDTEFRRPYGITIDSNDTIYIADRSNYRIRKVTADAVVTTLAGSSLGSADGTGDAAQFYYPQGITVDSSGTIYVVDQGSHRIRMIK